MASRRSPSHILSLCLAPISKTTSTTGILFQYLHHDIPVQPTGIQRRRRHPALTLQHRALEIASATHQLICAKINVARRHLQCSGKYSAKSISRLESSIDNGHPITHRRPRSSSASDGAPAEPRRDPGTQPSTQRKEVQTESE